MRNSRNNRYVSGLMRRRPICANPSPRWRRLATSDEKSCTPPMNTAPMAIHSSAGPHPNTSAALMGPTIGPAPAMELKWCPNTMGVGVGM